MPRRIVDVKKACITYAMFKIMISPCFQILLHAQLLTQAMAQAAITQFANTKDKPTPFVSILCTYFHR